MHKAQSAVSYAIKNLEEELGLQVLSRDQYRPQLTAAGEAVLLKAKRVLAGMEEIQELADNLKQGDEPALHLLLSALVPMGPVIPALHSLRQKKPHLLLHLGIEVLSVVSKVLREEAELGISEVLQNHMDSDTLEKLPLGEVRLVTVSALPGLSSRLGKFFRLLPALQLRSLPEDAWSLLVNQQQRSLILSLLGLILWISPSRLFAQISQISRLEDRLSSGEPLEKLEYDVADNPRRVAGEMGRLISQKNLPSRIWVRALLLRLQAGSLLTEASTGDAVNKADFLQALSLSRTAGFEEEHILLLPFHKNYVPSSETKSQGKKDHEQAMTLARMLGDRRLLVRTIADAALFYESYFEDGAHSLALAQEAKAIMKQGAFPRFEAAMTETKFGVIYEANDVAAEDVLKGYERALGEFKALGLRQFQVIMHYNVALSLIDDPVRTVEARDHLERILQLAANIEDWASYGQALSVIAQRDAKEGRWKDVNNRLSVALSILSQKDRSAYQEILITTASPIALLKGDAAGALRYLETAKELSSIQDPNVERLFLQQQHQALFALKRYREAYEAFQAYEKSFVASHKKEMTETREALKAEIGLTLAEQKTKALELENEYKSQKLSSLRNFNKLMSGFVLLSVAVIVALMQWLRQSHRLRLEQSKRQQILDLIDEGIVSIDRQGAIKEEHSPYLSTLFPKGLLRGKNVVEALFLPSNLPRDQLPLLRESLQACLGEDELAWDLNQAHIPRQIMFEGRIHLALHWQPLIEQGIIVGFLLGIRDVSSQVALEQDLAEQRSKSLALHVRLQELLSVRFSDACRLIERLNHAGFWEMTQEARRTFKQRVHTAKGEARSLGLKQLSQHLHECEDRWERESGESWSKFLAFLKTELQSYTSLIRELKDGRSEESSNGDLQLTNVCNRLQKSVVQELRKAQLELGRFVVDDQVLEWKSFSLEILQSCLVHGFANAADHGYIRPIAKGLMEARAVELGLRAYWEGQDCIVELWDAGYGLSFTGLRKVALERGLGKLSDEELIELVFEEGSSTADQVSQTSGRGVGLAAVRQLCREQGGDARLLPRSGASGTCLRMSFPWRKEAQAC